MKRKKAKKSIDIPDDVMKTIAPEAQDLLDQLELLDKQFHFYASECDKIGEQFDRIEENEKFSNDADEKQEAIAFKFLELEARYTRDKKTYDDLFGKISKYFLDKYGLNINFKDV
jgi:hypothetical protein